MPDTAFVALGSNLGDRAAYLAAAIRALTLLPRVQLLAVSRVEETVPLGWCAQGPYLNQMVALSTGLTPLALLSELQRIERSLGRVRGPRWGARTIDLDIVRLGDRSMNVPGLALPHPGFPHRPFWQREAAELTSILSRATGDA